MLAIEGKQAVIAERHAMGVAPDVPQDGAGTTEGRLGVDDPVGLEECVDASSPRRPGAQMLAAARQVEFVRSYARPNASTKLPRKVRLRTFTGKKKPAYLGSVQRS